MSSNRGNGRGGRRFMHGKFNNYNRRRKEQVDDTSSASTSAQEGFSQGGMRGGRPPGLRGKAIGLYYRDRQREDSKNKTIGSISLTEKMQRKIRDILKTLGVKENIPNKKAKLDLMETEVDNSKKLLNLNIKVERATEESPNANVVSRSTVEEQYTYIEDSAFKREFIDIVSGSMVEKLKKYVPKKIEEDYEQNEVLSVKFALKQEDEKYLKMLKFRQTLPAYKMRHDILKLIKTHKVILISGETGCGKTTQVPQFILDEALEFGRASGCRIVCTQPRRISAMSVADRVADERAEKLGESVGFQIRLENRMPRQKGSILFCTTGVLLKQMESDPTLNGISHLVIDEIHERNTIDDFLLTILKQVIEKRTDLKVILMSATLNANQFSAYYDKCPVLHIPGFTFPVEELYLEDVLQTIKFFDFKEPRYSIRNRDEMDKINVFKDFIEVHARNLRGRYDPAVRNAIKNPMSEQINIDLIAELIKYICLNKPEGAILVFLPGFMDISNLHKTLSNTPNRYGKCVIYPLHSKMPTSEQRLIFQRPEKGVRKIVIATNIAETSITIEDVVYVINCGKIKLSNYNVQDNLATLQAEFVSLANAKQRKGRAGRVQPGICYHLYTRAREMNLESYQKPEMLRSRLEEVVLKIKVLQLGDAESFLQSVISPPDPEAVKNAIKLLHRLNALDSNEWLTPLGFHLAKLPMDPQTGKMILMGAMFSCVDPVFSVAASLSFKDAFMIPLGKEKEVDRCKKELSNGSRSDHLVLVEAIKRWEEAEANGSGRQFCWNYYLSHYTLKLLCDFKKQFSQYLQDMKFLNTTNPSLEICNVNSHNQGLVKAIICAGLYPNVACIERVKEIRGRPDVRVVVKTPEDGTVHLHPSSVNATERSFDSKLLVYYLKMKSTSIYLHDTTMTHPLPLLFFGDNLQLGIVNGVEYISINENIKFKCRNSTGELIIELRDALNTLLAKKVSHPGVVDWNGNGNDERLLRIIAELISIDDEFMEMEAQDEYSN